MEKSKHKYIDIKINQSVNKLKSLMSQRKRLTTSIIAQKKNVNLLVLEKLNTSCIFTKDKLIEFLHKNGKESSVKEISEYFRKLGGTDIDTINVSNIYIMLNSMEKDGIVGKTKNGNRVTWGLVRPQDESPAPSFPFSYTTSLNHEWEDMLAQNKNVS